MTHTIWSVSRSATLLLTFVMLPFPIVAAYMGSPSDVHCEHAGEFFNCTVTDAWPLAEPGRLVAVRAPERVEAVKKRLVIVSPGGDVELRVPRSNEIADADLTAAAERLTALVKAPTAAPVTVSLSVPKGPTLLMAVLALAFYGLIVWGAGRNAVFTIDGEKLVVRRRWFGLVRKVIELKRTSVSDVQLQQVRSFYRLELVLSDGSRVLGCTVSYRRGKGEAETVRQLVQRGAA